MINSVKPLCSALPRPLLPAEFSVTARSTIRMKGAAQVAEKTPAVKLRAQSTNQGMWTISSLLRGTNGPPPPMIRRSPVRHEATRRHWSPDAGRVSERKRSEKRAPYPPISNGRGRRDVEGRGCAELTNTRRVHVPLPLSTACCTRGTTPPRTPGHHGARVSAAELSRLVPEAPLVDLRHRDGRAECA